MQIPRYRCKKRLATLWFLCSGFLFFLILIQTVFGRYRDAAEAWSWFLPTIMPTLSLMIGVLVMDTLKQDRPERTVDQFMFRLAFGLSAVYLLVVTLTILLQPFSALAPLAFLNQSNLWLSPFQGLVTGALGAFFVSEERPASA